MGLTSARPLSDEIEWLDNLWKPVIRQRSRRYLALVGLGISSAVLSAVFAKYTTPTDSAAQIGEAIGVLFGFVLVGISYGLSHGKIGSATDFSRIPEKIGISRSQLRIKWVPPRRTYLQWARVAGDLEALDWDVLASVRINRGFFAMGHSVWFKLKGGGTLRLNNVSSEIADRLTSEFNARPGTDDVSKDGS